MNPNEMNDTLEQLTAQVDEMNDRLEEAREERSDLLRQRFDLKEQRRYFRAQLREAKNEGNETRMAEVEGRLEDLEEQLDALDTQIDNLEDTIDATSDEIDGIVDQVDDLEEELQDAEAEADGEGINIDVDLNKAVEKLNSLLSKGFQKMADKLEQMDFEKMGESVQSAAQRAYRTVGGAAADAAKNVEQAWNDAKESREAPGGIGDYRISGTSTIDGGCYNRLSVSGSCKVSSDLVCREMRVSGSLRACGGLDCNGPVRTTGSLHVGGKLIAGSLTSSGGTKVQGDLESGPLVSTGSLTVGGSLKGTAIRSTGGLHVAEDVEADSLTTTGGLDIGGMVNADSVNIQVPLTQAKVGSIGGSVVRVTQSSPAGLLATLGVGSAGALTCDSIEGDEVDLTAVKAGVVRGATVVIRSGCDIGQVEYTDTCTVDGDARVGNCVKV